MDLDPGEVILAVSEAKDGPDQKVDSEAEEEDSPAEEDSREGSLTKAPLQRGKAEDKDKDRFQGRKFDKSPTTKRQGRR